MPVGALGRHATCTTVSEDGGQLVNTWKQSISTRITIKALFVGVLVLSQTAVSDTLVHSVQSALMALLVFEENAQSVTREFK